MMLPLGLIFVAGSAGRAGALVAAFALATALAPVRGRLVDRLGPRALTSFALACAVATWGLVLAHTADAPTVAIVALGGLVGLVAPPIGPFTRAVYGHALRERSDLLQRAYGLDSAVEEAAVVFAPLLVALAASVLSAEAALTIAATALLAGTAATARTALAPVRERSGSPAGRTPLPAALWLLIAALAITAASLGAIDIAVPAAAREQGHLSAAGVLIAVMAIATVGGSLVAGRRRWRRSAQWRLVALLGVMAAGIAAAASAAGRLELLGAALILPGVALGALFATLYLLADRLAPSGSGTRTFAWLVTANNGGLALGAAVAGALAQNSGADAGLWFGAACALAGSIPAAAAATMSARELKRAPVSEVR
jgi:MFS family permease